jgi:hypothetical protein
VVTLLLLEENIVHDISDLNGEELPSNKRLIKATFVAFFTGCILLVTIILPAEYGIDPTGLGDKLGLTQMSKASESKSVNTTSQPEDFESGSVIGPVWKSTTPFRSDTMILTLLPNQGAEIKAIMDKNTNLVFNWEVKGGVAYFDMHGEALNAIGDEFTSYWEGDNESNTSGAFAAPFDGTHGWYWQNKGSEPIEVHLSTSGFYKELYTP